jgi:NAD(P)-dependent dehydrogenase (short-subunit alcohol dehydrogenase family)
METNLNPATYIVTGATAGIGLACAELLIAQGGNVIGVGRSAERCRVAENRLRSLYPQGQATYLTADLSSQREVRALAERIRQELAQRDPPTWLALLNNAGAFTYWLTLTPEGFETQWAVNVVAPFLLTHELLPNLRAAPAARVVTVSSASHRGAHLDWSDPQMRRHYNGLAAYGHTKLADVLFTCELNRRLGPDSSVRAFAADPGLVKTDIGLKDPSPLVQWVWRWRRAGGISPQQSASGIFPLLCDPALQDSREPYWRNGQPRQASRAALDGPLAARLWTLLETMCGVEEATHD